MKFARKGKGLQHRLRDDIIVFGEEGGLLNARRHLHENSWGLHFNALGYHERRRISDSRGADDTNCSGLWSGRVSCHRRTVPFDRCRSFHRRGNAQTGELACPAVGLWNILPSPFLNSGRQCPSSPGGGQTWVPMPRGQQAVHRL